MATGTGFRVEGLTQVVGALRALGLDVDDLGDAFSQIAAEGAARVAELAPKRSGRLAGSVQGRRVKSKAVVAASVPYAGPINYGWPARNIAPAGFMQAADQVLAPTAVQRLEDDINSKIREKGLA